MHNPDNCTFVPTWLCLNCLIFKDSIKSLHRVHSRPHPVGRVSITFVLGLVAALGAKRKAKKKA